MTTYSINVEDVELSLLPPHTHRCNDFLKKDLFEFEVLKRAVEEQPTVVYTCHVCAVEVPAAFAREHAASVKHRASARIASVAAQRMRRLVAALPPPLAEKPPGRFCANCATMAGKHHDLSKEHSIAVMRDRLLWDLMKVYVNDLETKDTKLDYKDQSFGVNNGDVGFGNENQVKHSRENTKETDEREATYLVIGTTSTQYVETETCDKNGDKYSMITLKANEAVNCNNNLKSDGKHENPEIAKQNTIDNNTKGDTNSTAEAMKQHVDASTEFDEKNIDQRAQSILNCMIADNYNHNRADTMKQHKKTLGHLEMTFQSITTDNTINREENYRSDKSQEENENDIRDEANENMNNVSLNPPEVVNVFNVTNINTAIDKNDGTDSIKDENDVKDININRDELKENMNKVTYPFVVVSPWEVCCTVCDRIMLNRSDFMEGHERGFSHLNKVKRRQILETDMKTNVTDDSKEKEETILREKEREGNNTGMIGNDANETIANVTTTLDDSTEFANKKIIDQRPQIQNSVINENNIIDSNVVKRINFIKRMKATLPTTTGWFKMATQAKELNEELNIDLDATKQSALEMKKNVAKQLHEIYAEEPYEKVLRNVLYTDIEHLGIKEEDNMMKIERKKEIIHVTLDHFHSFTHDNNNTVCLVCKSKFDTDYAETHKFELRHMNNVAKVGDSSHCMRQVTRTRRHCIICNINVKNKNALAHQKSSQHLTNKNKCTTAKTSFKGETVKFETGINDKTVKFETDNNDKTDEFETGIENLNEDKIKDPKDNVPEITYPYEEAAPGHVRCVICDADMLICNMKIHLNGPRHMRNCKQSNAEDAKTPVGIVGNVLEGSDNKNKTMDIVSDASEINYTYVILSPKYIYCMTCGNFVKNRYKIMKQHEITKNHLKMAIPSGIDNKESGNVRPHYSYPYVVSSSDRLLCTICDRLLERNPYIMETHEKGSRHMEHLARSMTNTINTPEDITDKLDKTIENTSDENETQCQFEKPVGIVGNVLEGSDKNNKTMDIVSDFFELNYTYEVLSPKYIFCMTCGNFVKNRFRNMKQHEITKKHLKMVQSLAMDSKESGIGNGSGANENRKYAFRPHYSYPYVVASSDKLLCTVCDRLLPNNPSVKVEHEQGSRHIGHITQKNTFENPAISKTETIDNPKDINYKELDVIIENTSDNDNKTQCQFELVEGKLRCVICDVLLDDSLAGHLNEARHKQGRR